MKGTPHFVYSLIDSEGVPLYVGRSSRVATRIKRHHQEAGANPQKAAWFYRVRRVGMIGPFSYDRAARLEREAIEEFQPEGNIYLNPRATRAVDYRVALRARQGGES